MKIIALFGEAERGEYGNPLLFQSLFHLAELLGNPPGESEGIFYAIQALHYNRKVLYTRVEEEGFSKEDYFRGFHQIRQIPIKISAFCLPGVGDPEILEGANTLCLAHGSLLLTQERDLFDLLTAFSRSE